MFFFLTKGKTYVTLSIFCGWINKNVSYKIVCIFFRLKLHHLVSVGPSRATLGSNVAYDSPKGLVKYDKNRSFVILILQRTCHVFCICTFRLSHGPREIDQIGWVEWSITSLVHAHSCLCLVYLFKFMSLILVF